MSDRTVRSVRAWWVGRERGQVSRIGRSGAGAVTHRCVRVSYLGRAESDMKGTSRAYLGSGIVVCRCVSSPLLVACLPFLRGSDCEGVSWVRCPRVYGALQPSAVGDSLGRPLSNQAAP